MAPIMLRFIFAFVTLSIPNVSSECGSADFACYFREIEEAVKDIPDITTKITEMQDFLEAFTTIPISMKSNDDDNVNALKDKLKSCLDQITNTVNPFQAFSEVIQFPDFPLDPKDMVYSILAKTLLPFKKPIEFACDEGLPELIEFIGALTSGSLFSSRRRLLRDRVMQQNEPISDCEKNWRVKSKEQRANHFCDFTTNPLWTYASKSNGNWANDNYRASISTLKDSLIPNPYDVPDTEVQTIFRIIRFIFDIYLAILEGICNTVSDVMGEEFGKQIVPSAVCWAGFETQHILVKIFDFILESADVHNGDK
eukprot:368358_1